MPLSPAAVYDLATDIYQSLNFAALRSMDELDSVDPVVSPAVTRTGALHNAAHVAAGPEKAQVVERPISPKHIGYRTACYQRLYGLSQSSRKHNPAGSIRHCPGLQIDCAPR